MDYPVGLRKRLIRFHWNEHYLPVKEDIKCPARIGAGQSSDLLEN